MTEAVQRRVVDDALLAKANELLEESEMNQKFILENIVKLRRDYSMMYVAILKGNIIDSDANPEALSMRIRALPESNMVMVEYIKGKDVVYVL